MLMSANDVLDYWFGGEGSSPDERMKLWFMKSDDTDREIREKFGDTVRAALAGELDEWADDPHGLLALVIVLDQFPRNIFRETPRAYAGDAIAMGLTFTAMERGWDDELDPLEAFFLYLPLEHQEDIHLQHLCVERMKALADRAEESKDLMNEVVRYAEEHRDVVQKYGRFPHRNSIFGRPSTDAELEYLAKPGAGF